MREIPMSQFRLMLLPLAAALLLLFLQRGLQIQVRTALYIIHLFPILTSLRKPYPETTRIRLMILQLF